MKLTVALRKHLYKNRFSVAPWSVWHREVEWEKIKREDCNEGVSERYYLGLETQGQWQREAQTYPKAHKLIVTGTHNPRHPQDVKRQLTSFIFPLCFYFLNLFLTSSFLFFLFIWFVIRDSICGFQASQACSQVGLFLLIVFVCLWCSAITLSLGFSFFLSGWEVSIVRQMSNVFLCCSLDTVNSALWPPFFFCGWYNDRRRANAQEKAKQCLKCK